MLGQRYTTPMVTVVCPVTNLHNMASLQSASSCNCTSYAGIVSLMYGNTHPPLLPILSFLNITYPSSPNSAFVISLFAHDSVIPMIWGFISSTIMFNSFFLFIMILAFKHTHLIPDSAVFLCILCILLHLLSFCPPIVFFDKPPCPISLNTLLYPSHWQPPLTVPRQTLQPPFH